MLNLRLTLRITNKRAYNLPKAADYFINQQNSRFKMTSEKAVLEPLYGANHNVDSTDEIDIRGVPHGKDIDKSDLTDDLRMSVTGVSPDLIFLQIPPEQFIARQRFVSHKHAMNEVEDYDVKALPSLNPECPLSFEECIVNLNVLDMLEQNKLYDELNLARGIAAFSYPELQAKDGNVAKLSDLIRAVQKHVMGPSDTHSEYGIINQALYTALAGKHKVLLGEIPECLYRRRIASEFRLEELQDIFKYLLAELKQTGDPFALREAAVQYLPHIFQAPKDLYYTAMLKEAFQSAQNMTCLVGISHLNPIQDLWVPPPEGINFTRATTVKDRKGKETDEQVIEKHALLDVLLETRPWGKPYVSNPFSYLVSDITLVPEADVKNMVNCFRFNYEKYLRFKKAFLESHGLQIMDYKERRLELMEHGYSRMYNELESLELDEQDQQRMISESSPELKRIDEFGKKAFHFK